MALLGHHIVEQGLTRLAAVLTPARSHASGSRQADAMRFKPVVAAPPSGLMLARASALYSGQETVSLEQFATLQWLETLAASGRQLLLCHALRLLAGWNTQHRSLGSIADEAAVLDRLVFTAGQGAALLQQEQLGEIATALQAQINRLGRLKTTNADCNRIKATSLLRATAVLVDGTALRTEAMRLLELALPHLINADGGPAVDRIDVYVDWLQALLWQDDLPYLPLSRNALDRARPFLSMLLGADSRYCFAPRIEPLATVHATAPLRLAPESCVARLATGKSVVVAMPAQSGAATRLHVSSQGHVLLQAGLLLHGPDDDQTVRSLRCESADAGLLLDQQSAQHRRLVFLSAKGDDLRVEDTLVATAIPTWMKLTINNEAKVSVSRSGTQATIALGSRNLWQLTLRGATLLPPVQGNDWLLKSTASRVNWALKRINRATTQAAKPEIPELPF